MAATDYYVTTTGAGAKDGLAWATAFSIAEFETDLEASAEAGDRYFIAGGTYTCDSDIVTARDGTPTAMIQIIGVAAATSNEPPVFSDWVSGTARPLFDFSGSDTTHFDIDNYYILRNMRISGSYNSTSVPLVSVGTYSYVDNCYFLNTYNNAQAKALAVSTNTQINDCEISSTYGDGLSAGSSSGVRVYNSYVHDCGDYGIYLKGASVIVNSIITSCARGINVFTDSNVGILNCTIYGCTNGIQVDSGGDSVVCMNTTISGNTNGFLANASGTVQTSIIFDYNNWYNNTKDMTWDNGSSEDNAAKGPNATANAPAFTDAANGDFSPTAGSAIINAGFAMRLGVS